jgi:hypothetical protein
VGDGVKSPEGLISSGLFSNAGRYPAVSWLLP